MTKKILFIICFFSLFNPCFALEKFSKGSFASVVLTVDPAEITYGSKDAEITVIEYTALSCELCAQFHQTVFPEIKKKYIDTGKVRFIIRQFPIDHFSLRAATLLNQVPEVRRRATMDQLFAEQRNWMGSTEPATAQLAEICNLSLEKCQSIIQDQALLNETLQHRLNIEKFVAIEGTPTFVINGTLCSSTLTLKEFDKLVEDRLHSKQASVPLT